MTYKELKGMLEGGQNNLISATGTNIPDFLGNSPCCIGGMTGPEGPAGPMGPMGPAGVTGATGPAGPAGAAPVAKYIHVAVVGSDMTVNPGEDLEFDLTGMQTDAFVFSPPGAGIVIAREGIYRFDWGVLLRDPEAVAFAVTLNGEEQSLSCSGVSAAMSGSVQMQLTGALIAKVEADTVMTLRNTGATECTITGAGPSGVAMAGAWMIIQKLT